MGSIISSLLGTDALSKVTSQPIRKLVEKGEKEQKLVEELMADAFAKGHISSDKIKTLEEFHPMLKGMTNALYDNKSKGVYSSENLKDVAGVIAHELGHADNFASDNWFRKLTQKLYPGGKILPNVVQMANMVAAPAMTTGQQAGLAGLSSLFAVPTLIEEFSASNKGRKMLEGKGKTGLDAWTPFAGLPTYIGGALNPWITVGTNALFGVNKSASVKGRSMLYSCRPRMS